MLFEVVKHVERAWYTWHVVPRWLLLAEVVDFCRWRANAHFEALALVPARRHPKIAGMRSSHSLCNPRRCRRGRGVRAQKAEIVDAVELNSSRGSQLTPFGRL